MKFSLFIFKPPVRYNKGLFDIFAPQLNTILSVRISLKYFGGKLSNLSEIRQCRMQECPAYHDRAVFRFFFHENSTLRQSKLYIYMLKINSFFITKQKLAGYIWI